MQSFVSRNKSIELSIIALQFIMKEVQFHGRSIECPQYIKFPGPLNPHVLWAKIHALLDAWSCHIQGTIIRQT